MPIHNLGVAVMFMSLRPREMMSIMGLFYLDMMIIRFCDSKSPWLRPGALPVPQDASWSVVGDRLMFRPISARLTPLP